MKDEVRRVTDVEVTHQMSKYPGEVLREGTKRCVLSSHLLAVTLPLYGSSTGA